MSETNQQSSDLNASEWLTVVLGFLLLLTPLLSTNLAVFSGIMDQNYWVMFVVFVFAIIILLRQFFITSKKIGFKLSWLDAFVLGWTIWLVITSITSYNSVDSVFGVLARTGGLLHWITLIIFYFLLRTLIQKSSKVWEYALIGIMASGAAVAIMSIIKLIIGTQTGTELIGILGNQNFTAYFLAITAVTTFVYWLGKKRSVFDYALLALILQLAAIWFANARWVYIALFVVFLTIHIITIYAKNISQIKHRLLLGLWVLLVILGISNFAIGGKLYFNFSYATVQHRLSAWNIGLEASTQKPLFGWGLENYDNALQQNFRPEFENIKGTTETLDRPHNFLVLYLTTTGWLGLGLILALLGYAISLAWRNRSNLLGIWSGAVIMMYVVINLAGFEMMATTILLIMALAYLGAHAPPFKRQIPALQNKYIGLAAAGLISTGLIYFIAIPWVGYQMGWRALQSHNITAYDTSLSSASYLKPNLASEFLASRYSPQQGNIPFYGELAIYMQNNANQRENEPGYHLAIAKAWQLSDDTDKYLKMRNAVREGSRLYSDKNGYYWAFLADLELTLGNENSALSAIAKAMALNPNSVWTKNIETKILSAIKSSTI